MMHWYRPIANFYQIQVSVSMLTTIFCCWAFGEIVVDKGDREEHKMEKVVTKNWGMDKSNHHSTSYLFAGRHFPILFHCDHNRC